MKISLAVLTICMTTSFVYGQLISEQAAEYVWVKQFGGIKSDYGHDVAVDDSGYVYVAGTFEETVRFGTYDVMSNGVDDVFVVKMDSSGNVIWANYVGGWGVDDVGEIAVDDSGNCVIVGSFVDEASFGSMTLVSNGGQDIFVAKYNSSGRLRWAKNAGGSEWDGGLGIAVDSQGSAVIAGWFYGTAFLDDVSLTSAGKNDILIAKFDGNGNLIWARRAGSTYQDAGVGISIDLWDNCIVTGFFSGTAAFEIDVLTSFGSLDIFIAKYDRNGQFQWVRQAGGSRNDRGNDVSVDNRGHYIITGQFERTAAFGTNTVVSAGETDVFVAKYDGDGDAVWVKQVGSEYSDLGRGITATGMEGCIITGSFNGDALFEDTTFISAGAYDIFMARYGSSGDLFWAKQAGGPYSDFGWDVAADRRGNFYSTGVFEQTVFFDTMSIVSAGIRDVFVVRLTDTTIVGDGTNPANRPETAFLCQNYPNPFNVETIVRYYLEKSGRVRMKVFDLRGREIGTFVDAYQDEGWHTTFVDGNDWANGVYLCRLETEEEVHFRKMILLK